MPKNADGVVPGYRLFPHERWLVAFGVRQRRKIPELRSSKFDQNYGPVGVALFNAGMATGLPGGAIGMVGLILLLASGDRRPLVTVAYWTMGVSSMLLFLGMLRLAQVAAAGKRFRGDRPFQKGR
jgi:hypothetical protein